MNSLFFSNIIENSQNKDFLKNIKEYIKENITEQIYLISSPLAEKKYKYSYEENVVVILSPKHKIIFVDLGNDKEKFEEYTDDFIEDLGKISDKYNYEKYIGRSKKWSKELVLIKEYEDNFFISKIFEESILSKKLQRKNELLISLLVGSINNIDNITIEEPENLLEKVKNKILLFDGDQTNFIYKDIEKIDDKKIFIQGLAGTGKTELLFHKLKEIYIAGDNSKIFFTCHNKVLSNSLKERVPNFFDFMKVEKQIEWNKRLWVNGAWGSSNDQNSGLYRYICDFYNIPFYTYGMQRDFEKLIKYTLNEINNKDNFKYAFDFILIDESQDFPEIFFDLCEKITKEKIYIAGDIFQDIFGMTKNNEKIQVDVALNKCYRTDPRTFMFAQSIGMGLFEEEKINWLDDNEWETAGYLINRNKSNNRQICLSRESVRRFEDLEDKNIASMNIEISGKEPIKDIIKIIEKIKQENPTVKPDDIGIVIFGNKIYDIGSQLEFDILEKLNFKVNKGYETKEKLENTIFITNQNNAKGLEFPFVICLISSIQDNVSFRNSLYTMLTRSLIQSYLLVEKGDKIQLYKEGLKIINEKKCIKTIEPTEEEKKVININRARFKEKQNESYKEFLLRIFKELGIEKKYIKNATNMLRGSKFKDTFNDEKGIKQFIIDNKKYF